MSQRPRTSSGTRRLNPSSKSGQPYSSAASRNESMTAPCRWSSAGTRAPTTSVQGLEDAFTVQSPCLTPPPAGLPPTQPIRRSSGDTTGGCTVR